MVTKITLWALLGLLATAGVAQGRILAYSTETEFQAQLTTAPAGAQQATVRQVVGNAQARKSENEPWQGVKVGQVFDEGAEFRTGLRSRVVFSVPPDQTIILDRLGTVKLLIAKREGNEVRTSLGMPYGRTEYQVEEAGLLHNADIASPGATLAVRGTKNMLLYDQGPFTPIAFASQPVRLRNAKGQTVAFGRAGRRAHVAADKNSPGEQSLVETRVDPAGSFAGRTTQENAVLAYLARVAPDLDISQFRLLSLITDPNFKGTGIGTLPIPGQLEFTLFWTSFSDLDLTVISPRGEVVSASNPKVKSGGIHTGDEQSVKGQGEEHVQWNKGYPQGTYTFTVSQKVGKGGSSVFVDVVRDRQNGGERLGLFQTKISSQNPTYTNTITVGPPTGASKTTTASGRR
ncbi:MAG TPA: hypothetical protein VGP99_03145 [Tepidisphaeraceae bacterium]|jgi:hypothetical protein|nr:hypothetical protein [Tepidisphaeraceae bacterium]